MNRQNEESIAYNKKQQNNPYDPCHEPDLCKIAKFYSFGKLLHSLLSADYGFLQP
jgi:hypothetical protein